MNEFGAVLLELLEARGLDVYDLAERISAMPGAPEISGENLLAVMTADGEEFQRLMSAHEESVLHEN